MKTDDSSFRTVREGPDPFLPLVFDGIADDKGMVGTIYDMRGWKGKLREPPEK
jgi:hypothetical protein